MVPQCKEQASLRGFAAEVTIDLSLKDKHVVGQEKGAFPVYMPVLSCAVDNILI